jgi:hypothetical protein
MTITGIYIVVLVLVLIASMFGLFFTRHQRLERLHGYFGPEYDYAVEMMSDEKEAQTELEKRQNYIDASGIQPLTVSQRECFLAEWTAVQSKFVDEPSAAYVAADRLIMEVMQVRGYPVSDFEQRAADISVTYPALAGNYRSAREIALKNLQHRANPEELRQANIYYRSLFDELLGTEAAIDKG